MPQVISALTGVSTYQIEVDGYDTVDDLRSAPVANTPSWAKRAMALTFGSASVFDGTFGVYIWDPTSVAVDDGVDVIKPDNITGPGRWRLAASVGGGGAGTVATEGENYCFSGPIPNQILKVKNIDTGLANRVDTVGADNDVGWKLGDGSAC